MNRYTIPCTPDQTKKALELGAPLEFTEWYDDKSAYVGLKGEKYAIIPTAEQMLCWLEEEQGILVDVQTRTGLVYIYDRPNSVHIKTIFYTSRKESTLAAIDAALEYLTKNKNKRWHKK